MLIGESENADVGFECKDYIERRVSHLESSLDNLAVTSSKKPKRLDNKEAGPRGYNTSNDVVLAEGLPHINKSFKKSSNLLTEETGVKVSKRKAENDDGAEEKPKKKVKT